MTDEAQPIAYQALLPGTPVQTSDGQEFGRVERVLVVEEVDVFDGIVVRTEQGVRFVDADQVGSIYTTYVRTSLTAEQAATLPIPDQASPVYEADADDDTGRSFGDRFGRLFGRATWKREKD
jgi:sporulation protein YlmC with PRC-barrel domain